MAITTKTLSNYKGAYKRYISPQLGNTPLVDIQKSQILNALRDLPPQTYYQALMTTRVIFREALEHELVSSSPSASIKSKRINVKPQKFLTWEEIQGLDFGKYTSHIRFLALHGLRWGEAVVLTEDDISENKVNINKSIHGATKTKSGNRSVPYFGYFKKFPSSRITIANVLQPYGVTIHSLRKTYAYFLKSNNVHVTTASKFMGHSNPLITLKIYTMVRDDEIDQIGEKLRLELKKENE